MSPLSDAELDALDTAGRQVLLVFPEIPGACVMMSALYVGRLHDLGHRSARLVGGALSIGPRVVFGRTATAAPFSETNLDWDGHAWVRFGDRLADVSLVRTSYSAAAPATLAAHVSRLRRLDQPLYITTQDGAHEDGLRYTEQHIFSKKQVNQLYLSALTFLPA